MESRSGAAALKLGTALDEFDLTPIRAMRLDLRWRERPREPLWRRSASGCVGVTSADGPARVSPSFSTIGQSLSVASPAPSSRDHSILRQDGSAGDAGRAAVLVMVPHQAARSPLRMLLDGRAHACNGDVLISAERRCTNAEFMRPCAAYCSNQ